MFRSSMRAYETWLKKEIGADFVDDDLDEKHDKMRKDAFSFLRATYWRWAETILAVCPELAAAPPILSIGDTHLENFGTWRDVEGRLIWGANDFDEAAVMPYPLDIVRLATSAILARGAHQTDIDGICDSLLKGYREGLGGPRPMVLEQKHRWLRQLVVLSEKERDDFWQKFEALTSEPAPPAYDAALRAALPLSDEKPAFARRRAGTGSLGRPRFVASLQWNGGPVLREAKGLVMSGWSLAKDRSATAILSGTISSGRYRAVDPHYRIYGNIVVRRLSPNSRKIEVKSSADDLLMPQMLEAMGHEIANCHAGDAGRLKAVLPDLVLRPTGWLKLAAGKAAASVTAEFSDFAR